MFQKNAGLVILMFFISTLLGVAQTNQLKFRHLTSSEGLSSNQVSSIIQDHLGYMWIATSDGLNRYDGYDFETFKHDRFDSTSLNSNNIRCVFEDGKNNLWVGTNSGLHIYDIDLNNFHKQASLNLPEEINRHAVEYITEDARGNIWLALSNSGCVMYNPNDDSYKWFMHDVNEAFGLGDNFVESVFSDSRGNLWFATHSGLDLFNFHNETFTHFRHNPNDIFSLPGDYVNSIIEDEFGFLCVGTYGTGFARLNLSNIADGQFIRYQHDPNNPESIQGNNVQRLLKDADDGIWVAIENVGVVRITDNYSVIKTFTNDPSNPESLNNNSIYAMHQDVSGDVWLGTYSGGVNVIHHSKQNFQHFKSIPGDPSSLSYNTVTRFLEDSKGNVWVGTDGGGVCLFDAQSGKFKTYNAENSGLGSNAVLAVFEDSDGTIMVGTWGGGVNVFDPETEQFLSYNQRNSDIPNEHIFKIIEDKNYQVWLLSHGAGVFQFDKVSETFTMFSGDGVEQDPRVIEGIVDSYGNILCGAGSGLHVFDLVSNTITTYERDPDKNSISSNNILNIFEENDSIVWIGTDDGLNKWNRSTNKFTLFIEEDGLPNNVINGILKDQNGFLWLSTNKGISRFDVANKEFKNFGQPDGLQGNQFNRFSCLALTNGRFLFGGMNGFNIFDPNNITKNEYVPPVMVTSFRIANEEVTLQTKNSPLEQHISSTKALRLSHLQTSFSFDFTALNYVSSQKNQYKYMLEGFDDDWVSTNGQRSASYTNLDAGKYVFRVIASNNDEVWNEEGVSINIRVSPPWWKSWWFIILVIGVVVFLGYSFVKIRETRLKEDKQKLEQQLAAGKEELENNAHELEKQKEELRVRDITEKEQKWTNIGLVRLTDIISKYRDNVQKLCDKVLYELIDYLEVTMGGVVLLNTDSEDDKYLELVSSYAYNKEKLEQKRIEIGEGQAGTCFVSNKVLHLHDMPIDYIKLSSGLGETRLKSLLLVPLTYSDGAVGVLEFASLKPIESYQVTFLEHIAEILASNITAVRSREKTELLLKESKDITEEMKTQEEELQQNLEEIFATQEETARKEEELTKQIDELKAENRSLKTELENLKNS